MRSELRKAGAATVAAIAVLLYCSAAAAETSFVAGTGGQDRIYIGITDPPSGVSCENKVSGGTCPSGINNFVCRRPLNNPQGTAQWYYIGSGVAGLADDWRIRGGTDDDYMVILRSGLNLPSNDTCDGDTAWNAPTYNGHYIDLDGEGGEDELWGGSTDTWLYGGGGNDYLRAYAAYGEMQGGADDNRLISLVHSMSFVGGTGADCASTFSGGSNSYSMGSGDDDIWGDPSTGCPATFERRVTTWLCQYEQAFTTNGACP